jgi:hypothetical protein
MSSPITLGDAYWEHQQLQKQIGISSAPFEFDNQESRFKPSNHALHAHPIILMLTQKSLSIIKLLLLTWFFDTVL